jgi:peroxiredoxin
MVDNDGTIFQAYEVEGGGYSKRATFVVDGKGVIAKVYKSVKTDARVIAPSSSSSLKKFWLASRQKLTG